MERAPAIVSARPGPNSASSCVGCGSVGQVLKPLCASMSLFTKWVLKTYHAVVEIKRNVFEVYDTY